MKNLIMPNPYTIQILVPDGDPEKLRIINRQTSPSKFLVLPRTQWETVRNRDDSQSTGVYILTGYENPGDELPTIYVGQAENVSSRIDNHYSNKDFWDKAIIFVSNLNSAHAKWLEYALIKKLNTTNRSKVANGNTPNEPHISEADRANVKTFLKEIYETLPIAGLQAFEKPVDIQKEAEAGGNSEKNTIVVPAREDGFNRVFIGENAWYAIRIAGGMLDNIKYVAAYQTAPISAITHIATIKAIEPYGENGKYKLIFSGDTEELDSPIKNNLPQGSMQGPRYADIVKIREAENMFEVFE